MRILAATLVVLIPAIGSAQTTPPAEGDGAAPAAPVAATLRSGPPEGAMKLSEVLAALEARVGAGLAHIEEVDWDDDGHWDVEYRNADGSETEVKLDPVTGQAQN